MPIDASPSGTLDIENATLRSREIVALTNMVAGNDVVRTDGPALEVYGDPGPRLELVSNTLATDGTATFTRLESNVGVFSIQSGADASTNGPITFGGFANERMRITSDGNVGVGTNAPTDLLDVHYPNPSYGSLTGTEEGSLTVSAGAELSNAVVYFRTPFDAATPAKRAIFSDGGGYSGGSSGGLHFCLESTNDNTTKVDLTDSKMMIKQNGNVGIGTDSPSKTLDIGFADYGSPGIRFTHIDSGGIDRKSSGYESFFTGLEAVIERHADKDVRYTGSNVPEVTHRIKLGYSDEYRDSNGFYPLYHEMHFEVMNKTDEGDATATLDRIMTLRGNGNVGIGRTDPGYLLDMYKNATNGAAIRMKSSGSFEATISKKSSSSQDNSLQFTNSTTTGPAYQFLSLYNGSWQYPLTMFSDGRLAMNGNSITHPKNGVLTIYSTNVGNLVDQFVFKACTDGNVIGFFLNAAGAARGSISGVNASSIQYATTSDERLKKQIKPMRSTLDRINALKPCTYTWIRDEVKGYGFIAQEVHKVFPEMKPVVPYSGCTCKCGEERCESCTLCDDEHEYPKNKDGTDFYYGLDYGMFTPFITKAIQELDAKVEEHHNRKSLVTGVEYSKIDDYEGLVVSATTDEYRNTRPVLTLSNTENDKKCYGIILGKSNSIDNKTNIQKSGDGRMWVINTDGNLESGDLVTTSVISGYGKKQDDDILRSYTLAKLTQNCDFTEKLVPIKRIKQELKDVTYYLQDNYVEVADLSTVDKEDVIEREVFRYIKIVKETEDFDGKLITPEIPEEKYDTLTEEEKKSYTVVHFKSITQYEYDRIPEVEKVNYQETIQKINFTREVYESTKPMPECCGEYMTEVRRELVDVLDAHGQIQWEDDPSGATETAYKIRYLDADGNITDEANHVHKAAFVGCTYHCG